jgi:hypothetical protein
LIDAARAFAFFARGPVYCEPMPTAAASRARGAARTLSVTPSLRRFAAVPLWLALAAASGCVFVPRDEVVVGPPAAAGAPTEPSREAPRLEPLETRHLTLASGQDVVGEWQVLIEPETVAAHARGGTSP